MFQLKRTDFGEPDLDMARRAQKIDPELAEALRIAYVSRLKAVGLDRTAFEPIFAEVQADKRLSPADVIWIALEYRGGGIKPASKKAALETISKRFLELIRDHTKAVQAAKARPW